MEINSMPRDANQNGNGMDILSDDDDFQSENSSAKLYERTRIKALADERLTVQAKTFTKWLNSHLESSGMQIEDCSTDLRDGKTLLKMLEVLSGEKLPKPTRGKMRIHCLENVDKALNFLTEQHVHFENLGAHDIVDGNPRLTLGLLWTAMLRFQIQDITVASHDANETRSAKDALLLWCQMKTAGYPNANVRNFTSSWKDGLAFNALIHKHRPDLIDYSKLTKNTPHENLEQAFRVAKEELGITPLLDPEDVNVDCPDDKSMITYLVSLYHYFNKVKSDTVHTKRIGKVVTQALESQQMVDQYEQLTSDLLQWIDQTVEMLNDRQFANSLEGVQQQLASFNSYRTVEKPPKFTEKGNLEILLFTIHSKMRSNNHKHYCPSDGKLIADINRAWENLEKSEHSRELALREELMRQEKMVQLASRFDLKASMREAWLSENQRLVTQDNFGSDLAAVEAACKKHEAIETDIFSYEERVNAVVNVAVQLENEDYHDIDRINERKNNVLKLWSELLQLLKARRSRLDSALKLQNVFQEMIYLKDWIEEIKIRLQSDDFGKHLMGVDDLLQKHNLLEADIRVLGSRMNQILEQSQTFSQSPTDEVKEDESYQPCDPGVVQERGGELQSDYDELLELATQRHTLLQESRLMWQFFWDMADETEWIKEKGQMMSSPDLGHDLSSVGRLIRKHKAIEEELHARQNAFDAGIKKGQDLIHANNMGSQHIHKKIGEMKEQWEQLIDLTTERKQRLNESQEFYQLLSECDDMESYFAEILRIVSNEDVGSKLPSTELLIKNNQSILEDLDQYKANIEQLHEQANLVADYPDSDSVTITSRLNSVDEKFNDLLAMSKHRQQRLLDALSMYKVFTVAETVKTWITEKEKLLATLVPGDEIEELEVIRHRFDGFEHEMSGNAEKVSHVNVLSENLLNNKHPNSPEILNHQDDLNSSWNDLADIVEKQREQLNAAYQYHQFIIECRETANWIRDKAKLIESTDELGNDLEGIMQLQRRLGGLQRDLKAIEGKVTYLNEQAESIITKKPETEETIREKIAEINELWEMLQAMLKDRDARLNESSELQRFLQDLDHFQMWLSRTSSALASEDVPADLQEAEKATSDLNTIKEEITNYGPDFNRLIEFGSRVTEGQTDAQYVFLSQRLIGLQDGWDAIHKMADDREKLLQQSTEMLTFYRDALQVEMILNQEENYLSKEDVPNVLEQVQMAAKQHDNFMLSMSTSSDRIGDVVTLGQQLIEKGNFNAEKIKTKIDSLQERETSVQTRAEDRQQILEEQILLEQYLQDVDDMEEWLAEKMMIASDDSSFSGAKNISARYSKFKAFEEEIAANKDNVEKVIQNGEELIESHPNLTDKVEPRIEELRRLWDELNTTATDKSVRMAEANREVLFGETAKNMMSWLDDVGNQIVTTEEALTEEIGLVEIDEQIKQQTRRDEEVVQKKKMLDDLETHASRLKEQHPEREEEFEEIQQQVKIRLTELEAPLASRREKLSGHKRVRQFLRDVDDEKAWINEKLSIVESDNLGNSLLAVHQLLRRHKMLANEVENHKPRTVNICEEGTGMINEGHSQSETFREAIDSLWDQFEYLERALVIRQEKLESNEVAQQYLFDAGEAESWMAEQELYLMGEDRAKDEQAANNAMKKHELLEKTIENYADEIRSLGERSRVLLESQHSASDQVSIKQCRVDRMYAGLNELCAERRIRLEDMLKLFHLLREKLDLMGWIQERTLVASSHDMGVDFEHCCILREKFGDFSRDTNEVGVVRVNAFNELCDALIDQGHSEAAEIADWKDQVNEAWADLLELMETRIQLLKAAWELHKYLCDCIDVLDRINEKITMIPESHDRDPKTNTAMLRLYAAFEFDMIRLGQQVESIVESANHLLPSYASERERMICDRRDEILSAWRHLQRLLEQKKMQLTDSGDFHRFGAMVRELLIWLNEIKNEMGKKEKPRDVSGVELMMNNHRSTKAEIDAREENVSIALSLGRTLLQRRHENSEEVREQCIDLITVKHGVSDEWNDKWEELQLQLEVHQFARDAAIAESWLGAQETFLKSDELGDSLDETSALLKKHEDFEKTVATQDEKFNALDKPTTFEMREKERTPETETARALAKKHKLEEAIKEFQPPPPPPPQPEPVSEAAMEQARVEEAESEPTPGSSMKPSRSKDSADAPPATGSRPTSLLQQPLEGMLFRKHEWESSTKKASGRSWHALYMVLTPGTNDYGSILAAYKDERHFKERPRDYYRHEVPLDLSGSFGAPAADYNKRPNVLRLKLSNGGEYLFQARDSAEMKKWIDSINATGSSVGGSKSATLPHSSSQGQESGSQSTGRKKFFTLGRKK